MISTFTSPYRAAAKLPRAVNNITVHRFAQCALITGWLSNKLVDLSWTIRHFLVHKSGEKCHRIDLNSGSNGCKNMLSVHCFRFLVPALLTCGTTQTNTHINCHSDNYFTLITFQRSLFWSQNIPQRDSLPAESSSIMAEATHTIPNTRSVRSRRTTDVSYTRDMTP